MIDTGFLADTTMRLLGGLPLTLQLVALSILAGTALGYVLAIMRLSGWLPSSIASVYVFVFRGTPLLVQIFIIYYGLSQFEGLRDSFVWPYLRQAYWCAVLALALNTAAYSSEIIRGGLLSVSAGEVEAGRAIGSVRFIVLIEDAAAIAHAQAIAAADPRVVALGVGGEDLATDLGAEPTPDALDLPKRIGVVAARAAGVLPLGFIGTVAGLKDLDGYRAMLRRSKAIGFACASCVHPSQVAIINEEYGARPEEVERAKRLVAAFEVALAEGKGAVAFEGNMIDKPIVDRARRLIARAG